MENSINFFNIPKDNASLFILKHLICQDTEELYSFDPILTTFDYHRDREAQHTGASSFSLKIILTVH